MPRHTRSFAGPLFAVSLSLTAAQVHVAHAHAVLLSPAPRTASDLYKNDAFACGSNLAIKTNTPSTLTAGALINVTWKETVNHPGCFLFDLSTDGDKTFTMLKNVPHKTPFGGPSLYSADVQLPAGVTCQNCTFRMRQIMLGSDALPCPPSPIPAGASYYSCADVTLQRFEQPDAGFPPPQDMAMPPPPPPPPPPGGMESGCSVSAAPLAASWMPIGVALLSLLRRRRRA